MGIFGRKTESQGHSGTVGTDGKGGFVAVGNDGVAFGSGQPDPVDNLIELAGHLADLDEES